MAIKKKSPEAQNWVVREHACQHTATTHAQLRLNWSESISQTQLFPQVTQSQTDPDWIHYYAWMGGGVVERRGQTQSEFKPQSESRICWEMHTDHLSVDLCVECVCGGFSFACAVYAVRVLVNVCHYSPPESISSRMCQGQRCRRLIWKARTECVWEPQWRSTWARWGDVCNTLKNCDNSMRVLLEIGAIMGKVLQQ